MKRLLLSLLIVMSLSLFSMEPEPQEADQNETVSLAIDSSDLAQLQKLSLPVKSWVNFAKAHNKNEVHLPISKEVYDLLVPLLRFKATYGSLVAKPKPEITQRHALLGQYFQTIENAGSLEQLLSDYSSDALIHLLEATHLLELQDLFEKISSQLIMQLQDPETLSEFFKEYLNSDLKINLPDFMLDTMRKSIKIDEIFKHVPIGVQILQGHTDGVMSVAYSPDGKYLASGSADRAIRVWDASNGKTVKELPGHTDGVKSVAYSPDGKYLASGSADSTIRIFDLSNGEMVKELRGNTAPVISVAYSPDGKYLASGASDGTIRIFDLSNGEMVKELPGHTGSVNSVAYSPDGKYLASGSADGTIRVWHMSKGKTVKELQGRTGWVMSVAYSPDGKYLASESGGGTIRLWDVSTGEIVKELQDTTWGVTSVAYSPDGQYLAGGYSNGIIGIWDASNGKKAKELQGHIRLVNSLAYSPDGKYLASGSFDKTIRIWDLRNENYIRMIAGNNFHLAQLLLLNSIIACYKDNIPFDRCQYPQLLKVFNKIPENIIKTLEDKQIVKKEKMSCVIQ